MKKPKTLMHYTNLNALVGGIIDKGRTKGEEVHLLATNSRYLNDPSEIKLGKKELDDIELKLSGSTSIVYWDLLDTFILSFSKSKDSLPMWSMYGKGGSGIALELETELLCKDETMYDANIWGCSYSLDNLPYIDEFRYCCLDKNNKKDILSFMCTVADIQELKSKLPFLRKHKAYEYEQEWRLIIRRRFSDCKIGYRCSNNMIIPYINVTFPKEVIRKIWIAPTANKKMIKSGLNEYLKYIEFSHVKIEESKIPYRMMP